MIFDFAKLALDAKKAKHFNATFFRRLKMKPLPQLDEVFHRYHEEAFAHIDCLSCGNCCRSLGPRITDREIDKLSKFLRIKPSVLVEKWLRIDEDDDYVFKSMPCPFLGDDNYCSVYEVRPKACREYPHTDSQKMVKLLDITLRNVPTCPAVFEIVENVRKELEVKK